MRRTAVRKAVVSSRAISVSTPTPFDKRPRMASTSPSCTGRARPHSPASRTRWRARAEPSLQGDACDGPTRAASTSAAPLRDSRRGLSAAHTMPPHTTHMPRPLSLPLQRTTRRAAHLQRVPVLGTGESVQSPRSGHAVGCRLHHHWPGVHCHGAMHCSCQCLPHIWGKKGKKTGQSAREAESMVAAPALHGRALEVRHPIAGMAAVHSHSLRLRAVTRTRRRRERRFGRC